MPIQDWDKEEVKRLSSESGKPLEVQCALPFLSAGWVVRLGTFYHDFLSQKARELDFLAERFFELPRWKIWFRIFGSCKGFPAEAYPAMYTLAPNSVSVESPGLMCVAWGTGASLAQEIRRTAASWIIKAPVGSAASLVFSQAVGFDVFKRDEDKKTSKHIYSRVGDSTLYEGLDSAIKAAVYWFSMDRKADRIGRTNSDLIVNIPLLVSSRPFWTVPVNMGVVAEPQIMSMGFHTTLYPWDDEKPPQPITSILCEQATLGDLVQHLEEELVKGFIHHLRLSSRH